MMALDNRFSFIVITLIIIDYITPFYVDVSSNP